MSNGSKIVQGQMRFGILDNRESCSSSFPLSINESQAESSTPNCSYELKIILCSFGSVIDTTILLICSASFRPAY